MKPLVEITNLVKYFDIGSNQRVHAVDDVSFSIYPKEVVGLVGESGSGKSTLGKTLLGLHDKTSGSISFAGKQLPQRYQAKDFRAMAPKMQMIFQDPYTSLNPRMTVGEIVAGGNSNVTAEVKAWDSTNRQLQVFNRSGIFTIPETVTGQTSGAAWTSASYNTLNNVNTEDSIDQNFVFETADDDIIDFSEGNPFGSVGSTTDTTI